MHMLAAAGSGGCGVGGPLRSGTTDASTFSAHAFAASAVPLLRHLGPVLYHPAIEHAHQFEAALSSQMRLEAHLQAILTRCEQLSELHDKHQSQMTNATLFRLTALQSVFFPLTVVAGIYGAS